MAERPILFSSPMVRALLACAKTQTRRVIKPRGHACIFDGGWTDRYVLDPGNQSWRERFYPYRVGDRLYVREAWRCNGWATDVATIFYRASEGDGYTAMCEQYPIADKSPLRVTGAWRPGIHMPRWASRLTLAVTDVRVQRLQDISEEDAEAEGLTGEFCDYELYGQSKPYRFEYSALWNHLNAARGSGWDTNPWVVAVTFAVEHRNIDAPLSPGEA